MWGPCIKSIHLTLEDDNLNFSCDATTHFIAKINKCFACKYEINGENLVWYFWVLRESQSVSWPKYCVKIYSLSDHYFSCLASSSFPFSCWSKNICWKGSSTFSIVLCTIIPPQQQEQQSKNWIATNIKTLTMWKGRDKIANRDKCPNFSSSRMPKDSLSSLYRLFFFRSSHSFWHNIFPRIHFELMKLSWVEVQISAPE